MQENIKNLNIISIAKDLKYISLYNKLYFFEYENKNIFYKKINNYDLQIDLNCKNDFLIINDKKILELNSHDSFVLLELIIHFLENDISFESIKFDVKSNIFSVELKNKIHKIFFKNWDEYDKLDNNKNIYSSRLWSGIIERKFLLSNEINIFFESYNNNFCYEDENLCIKNGELIKLNKNNIESLYIPEGTTIIKSGLFSENQNIKEIILPKTLISLGGDTFYNAKNLEKLCIPENTKIIGDNPFAGCEKLLLENKSKYFNYVNDVLYNSDFTEVIHCNINSKETKIEINENVIVINKHSFYMCKNLSKLVLPKNLLKMTNNPFSGCFNLEIKSNSKYFYIDKKYIIYNFFKDQIISFISNDKIRDVKLLDSTRIISRNSFWNCKLINNLYIGKNIEQIGYNPFVSCENINFIVDKRNKYYCDEDGILYNKEKSKLIAYPKLKAVGNIDIIDSVIELERGAFSGCWELNLINLKNVSIINNKCFSNCTSLKEIYLSDFVSLVGDSAFSYCKNLKNVSYYQGNESKYSFNAFNNSNNVNKNIRTKRENYLINSENLYTLKSMINSYKDEIDLILIDPPYNSKVEYIEYNDDYGLEYFNFINERVSLSKKLLSEKGWLVITIDEDNKDTIIKSCNDIFGRKNVFVKKWEKLHQFFDKNRVKKIKNKKDVLYEYIIFARKSSNSIENKICQPYIENGFLKEKLSNLPEIFSCFGTNSSAKDEIYNDFKNRDFFSTPKPIKLFKEIIRGTTNSNSIILDYFAGSGTTGIACMELNHELNENRKFILINNSENNICELITKERLLKHCKNRNDSFVFI